MLTLNRNRQTNSSVATLYRGALTICASTLAIACCVASTDSLAVAQLPNHNHRDHTGGMDHSTAANPLSSQESSILMQDEDSNHISDIQPLRPSFTARPQERTKPLRPSGLGFEIPSSPTRGDFTNPDASGATRNPASDGSNAIGTFAHETREPADRFAEPNPPSVPIRSFNSSSVPVRVAQSPEPNEEVAPIIRNGLRPMSATAESRDRPTRRSTFDRRDQPKVDSMTASPRFGDTFSAPPAAMPGTSPARFNPKIFSRQDTKPQQKLTDQSIRQPVRELAHETVPAIDNQVAATSYAQPVADEAGRSDKLAERIVNRYSMDNAAEPLPGEPISLTELLQQPLPAQNRPAMVSQYWETWFDWASLQNAIAYQEWLATVPNASAQGEQGLLDTARSAAANQVLAAEIQLGKSQAKLTRFMPTRRSALSPLPSDLPLVERYETHYEIYKARNLVPTKLLGIDQMLPQTLKLINNRAQTVQKAQAAIKQNLDGYSRRQTPLASVLEAARVWRSSEQELLASVTNYNQAIADYAFNITRNPTTPERAVAMLIGKPKVKTEALPTASRTAAASFGGNTARNTSNTTGQPFSQPLSNRAAAASTSFSRPAPTDRPAWNGGSSTSRSRPSAPASSGRTADARPSLNTNSGSSFGADRSPSSGISSPAAFRSFSPGSNSNSSSASPAATSRTPAGGISSSRSASNGFGGTTSKESSQPSPKSKPFPLPKRPKPSNNNFGAFGS